MVKLHAELASLPSPRTTVDVDSALHLETQAITFGQAAELLRQAGYSLDMHTRHAYRFDRGSDRVDVMCSDRHFASKLPRYMGRPLFGVPGATRALQHTINLDVSTRRGVVQMVIPDARGALVLKGAAHLEDSRDRERHAEDAVILLACVADPVEAVSGLSAQSRKRLRHLLTVLTRQTSPWTNHDPLVQSLAREALDELSMLLHVPER